MKIEICDRCYKQYGKRNLLKKILLIIPENILRFRYKKIEMCSGCLEEFMQFEADKQIKLKK